MKRAMLICMCWMSAVADGPVGLVGVSPAEVAPVSTPPVSLGWIDWRWFVALVVVGAISILIRWVVNRGAMRKNPSGAGFVALCRRLGVSRSEQRTLESLARTHGNASAASLMLCPSAFETAASLVKASSGAKFTRNIERLRTKLA